MLLYFFQKCILSDISYLKERAIMSQQRRPMSLSPGSAVFLSLLAGMFLFVWRYFSKSTPSTKVTKNSVETSPEDTLAYWTKDKMRHAKAMPLPIVNEPKRGKRGTQSSPSDEVWWKRKSWCRNCIDLFSILWQASYFFLYLPVHISYILWFIWIFYLFFRQLRLAQFASIT